MVKLTKNKSTVDKLTIFSLLLLLLLTFILSVSSLMMLTSCSTHEDNSFRVGLYESGPPLVFMEDRKVMTGFEVELTYAISEHIDKKLEITFLSPDETVVALENGSVDCVISSLELIQRQIEHFDSTDSFLTYGVAIVKLTDDTTIKGLHDLVGKKVGVTANTDAEKLCEDCLKEVFFDLQKYDLPNQPLQELRLKKKDAAFCYEYLARYYENNDPSIYEILPTIYQKKQYCIKLSKSISDSSAKAIDEALLSLKQSGALAELCKKWFGCDFADG